MVVVWPALSSLVKGLSRQTKSLPLSLVSHSPAGVRGYATLPVALTCICTSMLCSSILIALCRVSMQSVSLCRNQLMDTYCCMHGVHHHFSLLLEVYSQICRWLTELCWPLASRKTQASKSDFFFFIWACLFLHYNTIGVFSCDWRCCYDDQIQCGVYWQRMWL